MSIGLNFGCPARRVNGHHGGAAILRDPRTSRVSWPPHERRARPQYPCRPKCVSVGTIRTTSSISRAPPKMEAPTGSRSMVAQRPACMRRPPIGIASASPARASRSPSSPQRRPFSPKTSCAAPGHRLQRPSCSDAGRFRTKSLPMDPGPGPSSVDAVTALSTSARLHGSRVHGHHGPDAHRLYTQSPQAMGSGNGANPRGIWRYFQYIEAHSRHRRCDGSDFWNHRPYSLARTVTHLLDRRRTVDSTDK